MFVNRETELDYLEQLNKKKDPRLIVVYGRRRIGKTELLRQFSKRKKHLFFTSDLSSEQEQLRQFTDRVNKFLYSSLMSFPIFVLPIKPSHRFCKKYGMKKQERKKTFS